MNEREYLHGRRRRERELDQPTNQRTVGVEGTKKANVVSRPVVLFHVLLPGLGRGRVECLSTLQIFYSSSAQPRQKDMQENYRSGCQTERVHHSSIQWYQQHKEGEAEREREGDKRPPNYHASSHTRSYQRGRAPTSFGLFLIEGTVECDTASFMLRFLAFFAPSLTGLFQLCVPKLDSDTVRMKVSWIRTFSYPTQVYRHAEGNLAT